MSGRKYQSIIVQMKEAAQRTVGVVDPEGIVVASSDLSLIGTKKEEPLKLFDNNEEMTATHSGSTFKLIGQTNNEGYAVFTEGEDELSKAVCIMAAIAINEAGVFLDEKHDKRAFIKTIITENILPGDIFIRAKEMNFTPEVTRGVLVIRVSNATNLTVVDLVSETFPDKQKDFVFTVGDTDIVLVKEMLPNCDTHQLIKLATTIHDKIEAQLGAFSVIGVGMPAYHLRELAERYKQALIAIDIGRVFETGKSIISYENLGICRLIYQLPTTLCEIFLSEVFKTNPIETLDAETLFTIDSFFENSLNVSETARKLYVHRNTLVYRLDKIKKTTGLDLREFDHAIVFKVALMVKKYLISQEQRV